MLGTENLNSQLYSREEVLAAYIFNFAQNIEWHNEENIDTFHFKIVTGNIKIAKELNQIGQKKKIRNKSAIIIAEGQLTHTENIHLIFVTKDKEELIPQIFDKIEGKNILLISEQYENKKIVMINFDETQDQRLEFEINKANIINQGLTILPEMVLLGGTEIDVAALYRESQENQRILRKQLDSLQRHEKELKKKIETSNLEIMHQSRVILSQTASIDSQTVRLALQKRELTEQFNAIALKQDTLNKQTMIIGRHEKELNEQKEEIARRESILAAQLKTLDSLSTKIELQNKYLEAQDVTISTQQKMLCLLIIIVLLAIGLSFSIYRGYKNNRKINARLTKEIEERKQVEEALGKSEDLYNHAPCGYHSLDANGEFVRMNDTELNWLGYNREEVVGKMKFIDLVTETSKKTFEEKFSRFKALGIIRNLEFEMIRKDGSILPIELSATALTDNDGNFLMSRSSIFDITERKQAEKELAKYREHLEELVAERTAELEVAKNKAQQYLDIAGVIMLALDADRKVILINQKGCEVLGYPIGEIIGTDWFETFVPQYVRQDVVNVFHQLMVEKTESVKYFENRVVTKNGDKRLVAWHNVQLRDDSGNILGILSSGEDITERKLAEEQINKLNQDLQERAVALEAANKELETFAYSVSHDLRAPLRHIDGFMELLQQRTTAAPDEQSQHYMATISESAKQMGRLIDALLAFSRMGRQELSRTQVDLNILVRDVVRELESETKGRTINWHITDLPVVFADRTLIRAVFVNLISNAIKFTHPREQAEIKIGCQVKNTKTIVFIRDNGVGFDSKYADKLFGVFQRLHHADDFEGSGIGLANVRRIIERHGGKTWAEGIVDHGAVFYFSLPISD